MKTITNFFYCGRKKHEYTLTLGGKNEDGQNIVHVFCEPAGVDQDFLEEDVLNLLADLPEFVKEEQDWQKKQKDKFLRFRVNSDEKERIEEKAFKKGYKSMSEYLRGVALA